MALPGNQSGDRVLFEGLAIELLIADANQKAEKGWRLPAIQREALELVRDALDDEIQGARDVLNRFEN